MLTPGKLHITLDGQFGSTGKGLLNSFIAKGVNDAPRSGDQPFVAISNAAPNAGHTYVDDDGVKRTVFHLPVSGVLVPDSLIFLCAGSIIDPKVLAQEVEDFGVDPTRVFIHPRACILLPEHKEREAQRTSGATKIASTQKGVGAALADKVARVPGTRTAGEYYKGADGFRISDLPLAGMLDDGATMMMEVPQGFSLSLNHGHQYPQCTSRDLTVGQALNDAGLHPKYLGEVYVALRTYPIRVGNIVQDGEEIGNSGGFYSDSIEKTWEQMGEAPELTTVTKRVRRVATFSHMQYMDMVEMVRPDVAFLNFCNYLNSEEELAAILQQMFDSHCIIGHYPKEIWFGWGPSASDIVRVFGPLGAEAMAAIAWKTRRHPSRKEATHA